MTRQDTHITESKHQLLKKLNSAREDLWRELDKIDENIVIYPGWKKCEFLAHIAGWEAMVFDVIYRHIHRYPARDYAYTGIDSANERFVSVRKTTTLDDAKLECEINRFAILKLLDEIDDFDEVIHFPWGENTVSEFIEGAIEHELSHLKDIIESGASTGF